MLGEDLIKRCIKSKYQKGASVIALIPEEHSWWHVHRDEIVPNDRPITIRIRL